MIVEIKNTALSFCSTECPYYLEHIDSEISYVDDKPVIFRHCQNEEMCQYVRSLGGAEKR